MAIKPLKPIGSAKRQPQLNSIAYRKKPLAAAAKAPNAGNNGGAQPFVPVPRAPAAPRPPAPAPPPPPPPAPRPPPGSPLDAQYFVDTSRRRWEADSQVGAIQQASAYERAALAEALRRLGLEQPKVERSATHGANNAGLLYSGALGQDIGDIRTDFLRRRTDAQNDFDANEAGRQAEIAAIRGGLTHDLEQFRLDAIGRQQERDAAAPLAAPPPPPAPRAAARRRTSAAGRAARARARREATRRRRRQQQRRQQRRRRQQRKRRKGN